MDYNTSIVLIIAITNSNSHSPSLSVTLSTAIQLMPERKSDASDTSITSPMEIRLHKLRPQVTICTHLLSHRQTSCK